MKILPIHTEALRYFGYTEEESQLDSYAKFIEAPTSYVITEALKLLFRRDDDFKAWLVQQTTDSNCREQPKGGVLTKTA
jgi:hypothetical protein